jgi:hypothetical protein
MIPKHRYQESHQVKVGRPLGALRTREKLLSWIGAADWVVRLRARLRHSAVGKSPLAPVADHGVGRALLVFLLAVIAAGLSARPVYAEAPPHLGYGSTAGVQDLGFDWVKSLDIPATDYARRLIRVDLRAPHLGQMDDWLATLETNVRSWAYLVDAYEIGNEPNLDADYGWDGPPDAADYVYGLCRAYATIKAADPDALVVTAGLAPTGRIPFVWEGHRGYCAPGVSWCPVYYQDEREFLREMLAAGGGACFDALGYHPVGFNAPYDAAPGSAACGPNDFCFRSVERIYTILHDEFGLSQPVWATEFGWIVDPRLVGRPECWSDPSMAGFQWMVVSPEAQAANLVGAYRYAEANYPWMGAMVFFNYGLGSGCNQMAFFNVQGRPAETALTAMTKNYVPSIASWSGTRPLIVDFGDDRVITQELRLDNLTYGQLRWRAEIAPGGSLNGHWTLTSGQGVEGEPVRSSIDPTGLAPGAYVGHLILTASGSPGLPVQYAQQQVDLRVLVATGEYYLPIMRR